VATVAKPPKLDLDILVEAGAWPPEAEIEALARRAIGAAFAELGATGNTEVSLVLTDDAHIRELNATWRGKDKPTNVLSFPANPSLNGGHLPPLLGDIVVAQETVAREAALENKPFDHHLTHLIIHGLLHLVGRDHEEDAEAEAMEGIERRALARLAISDPYA
jgi:probable rRNA maturation factor